MMHSAHLAPGKLPGPMLKALINRFRTDADPSVIVEASYGVDAAAIHVDDGMLIVKSDPITFTTDNAAAYLVAVNSNDLACLGGIPRWMTVVSLLPENGTTADMVERMFAELQDACDREGISLIGGHTEITIGLDRPLLIATLLGTVGPSGLLKPGRAQVGDGLFVTRPVGIEGTAILATDLRDRLQPMVGNEQLDRAAALQQDPGISITAHARRLLATGLVHAMHDPTEGGIATAVHEIAEASGLTATIDTDAIPILPETRAICEALGLDPLGLLSSGTVLFAAPDAAVLTLEEASTVDGGITRIGQLTSGSSPFTLIRNGGATPLPRYDSDELTRAFADKETPMETTLPEIIMYGRTSFCPDVARSRMRLEELGYEWTEYDVEQDASRREEMMALTGRGNVPTLVIGDSVLVEPQNDALDEALRKAGYDVDARLAE